MNGVEGKVKNIKILTTALITYDNKLVVLPNSAVANNAIINYSNRRVRRVEFLFKVDYSTDVDLMKKVVTDVMKSDGRVQLQPAPFCSIKSFDEDGIEFFCHCWCASEDYWDVFYYIMDNVFNEFKRNKIKIPHKQIELRMKENEKELPVREQPLPERCNEKKVELEQEETLESFFKKFDGRNWGKKDSEKRRLKKEQKAKEKAEKQSKKSKQKLEKKVSNTQTSSQSLIANGENSSNASSDERNEN